MNSCLFNSKWKMVETWWIVCWGMQLQKYRRHRPELLAHFVAILLEETVSVIPLGTRPKRKTKRG